MSPPKLPGMARRGKPGEAGRGSPAGGRWSFTGSCHHGATEGTEAARGGSRRLSAASAVHLDRGGIEGSVEVLYVVDSPGVTLPAALDLEVERGRMPILVVHVGVGHAATLTIPNPDADGVATHAETDPAARGASLVGAPSAPADRNAYHGRKGNRGGSRETLLRSGSPAEHGYIPRRRTTTVTAVKMTCENVTAKEDPSTAAVRPEAWSRHRQAEVKR